jgi:rare lipoprotein A
MKRRLLVALAVAILIAGCSSVGTREAPEPPVLEAKKRAGGYYLDDGPGDKPPPNLEKIPDAVPRDEPLHRFANRPYEVMGVSYMPLAEHGRFRQEGIASWYGRRYHSQKTSSGEPYDMYAMTAAHPTLPIPSYARVTSLDTGKSVVVRINDRGPFKHDRVIDLSYTAAFKLGLLGKGSGMVRVESVQLATAAAQPGLPAGAGGAVAAKPADNGSNSGYYVQLGAFGNPANAEKLRSQAREALGISPELVQVALVGNLHRVKLGPFANEAEASGWVEKSRTVLDIPAIKVTR